MEVTLKKSSAFQNIVVEKGANGKAVLSYDNKDIVRNIKVGYGTRHPSLILVHIVKNEFAIK